MTSKNKQNTVTYCLLKLIRVIADIEDACYIHCTVVDIGHIQQETFQRVNVGCKINTYNKNWQPQNCQQWLIKFSTIITYYSIPIRGRVLAWAYLSLWPRAHLQKYTSNLLQIYQHGHDSPPLASRCYVLLVLWMTSYLHIMASNRRQKGISVNWK